jgi:hypothetical protein
MYKVTGCTGLFFFLAQRRKERMNEIRIRCGFSAFSRMKEKENIK